MASTEYTTAERTRLYQKAFDEFVYARQLDTEYPETWSGEDNRDWDAIVDDLKQRGILR